MSTTHRGRHRAASKRRYAVLAEASAVGRLASKFAVKAGAGLAGTTGLVIAGVIPAAEAAGKNPGATTSAGKAPTITPEETNRAAFLALTPRQPATTASRSFGRVGIRAVAKPKPSGAAAMRATGKVTMADMSKASGLGAAHGLTKRAMVVLAAVSAAFPQITNIIGVRPDSLPDHPSGRALDFMIPNWSSASGVDLGNSIVAFVQAHATEWNVYYIIYRQRIWFPGRGWQAMSNRGSATANHMDHVHVSVNP